jgi:sigma-B regulation protein RsbQ
MTISKRNNVKVFGSGERVLMFGHGYGCDQTMWEAVTPAFERDYKIVLFDYVGAGQSDFRAFDKDRYSSLHGYALDVLEICVELNLERVTFVGHSVSAMIGAMAAILEPEWFENLVMIGPSSCYLNDEDYVGGFDRAEIDALLHMIETDYGAWSTKMAPVVAGNPDKPEVAAAFAASLGRNDVAIAQSFARVTFLSDHRGDLPKLTTRTLILQAKDDVMAVETAGRHVSRCIADSRFVMLNATGHLPHVSSPGAVIEAMKSFLEV